MSVKMCIFLLDLNDKFRLLSSVLVLIFAGNRYPTWIAKGRKKKMQKKKPESCQGGAIDGKGPELSRCRISGTRLHLKADSEISRGQNVTEQSGRTRENNRRDSTRQSIKEKDRLANLRNRHGGAFRANSQELPGI